MKLFDVKALILLVLGTAWLAGCSNDPNRQKIKHLNQGERYFKSGKYREAVIEFRNAVEADPRFAEAHYQLGRVYLILNNPESAYRELKLSVTLNPANSDAQLQLASLLISRRQYGVAQEVALNVLKREPHNARAHSLLGQKHIVTGDLPNALLEFQKAVELNPGQVENYTALGALYLAQGRLSEAETVYRNAIAANPKSLDARVSLGQFYFSQGKMAAAETEMRAACDLDSRAVPPRLLLGRLYLAAGKPADAEKLYTALKTTAPDDPKAYPALGLFYLSVGLREKAAAEFQAVAAAKPKDAAVKAYWVETLIDLGRIQQAAPLVQEVLKANPGNPQALVSEGRILLAEGKNNEAMAALQKAVNADQKSANAYYYLGGAQKSAGLLDLAKDSFGRALKLQPQMSPAAAALASLNVKGDPDEALRLADNALKTDAGLPSAYLARARALLAKGDTRQGEAVLQDALRRDPASLPALGALLNLYSRQGRAQEAVQRISGLLQRDSRNAGLHFLSALGYFNLKDLDKSEAGVRQALALDPKTPQAYTLLANIDFARGSVEKAKTNLRAAIAASPRNPSNYMALATQYEKENNWEEAKKLFEKAREIDPASPYIAAELAFLYLEHGGDVNVAVSLARMAKQAMPKSPIAADALGWAYYKLGSIDPALAQLRQATEQVPHNPMYQYHLGIVYVAARRADLARKSLQAALKSDPAFLGAANAREALAKLTAELR